MSAAETLRNLAEAHAPRPARPGFIDAMQQFMSTPGAKSTDAVFNMPRGLGKTTILKEAFMAKDDDELDDKTALQAGIADLAAELDAHFKSFDGESSIDHCTLAGPELLTVWSAAKGYRKDAHVGGEDFIPVEAYMGKKGKIIVKFKPAQAAGYELMEMGADDAMKALSGFNILAMTPEGPYEERIVELNVKKSNLREQERNKDKFEQYADLGFGTF